MKIILSIKRFMRGSFFKKTIPLFILIPISLGVFANSPLVSKQQIGMFKNSITCVVLESGISSYNVYMTAGIEKYWKSTEYEIIDQEEFNKRRFDSKYSFLVLLKGVYGEDPGGVGYDYISLVLGDKAIDITDMPEICSIPLTYSGDSNADFGYAIPAIVKFIQKHAEKLESKRFLILLRGLKYYNSSKLSTDKVLLIDQNQLAPDANTLEKIKTVYPHYVKIVTNKEIQTELGTEPINTIFIFHVGPSKDVGSGKCFEMVFDVEGNLYYYNHRKVTNKNKDGFTLKDFRRIR